MRGEGGSTGKGGEQRPGLGPRAGWRGLQLAIKGLPLAARELCGKGTGPHTKIGLSCPALPWEEGGGGDGDTPAAGSSLSETLHSWQRSLPGLEPKRALSSENDPMKTFLGGQIFQRSDFGFKSYDIWLFSGTSLFYLLYP